MTIAARAAIRLHPARWRERYADEVLGTLLDVADDRGGAIPLSESVPLGLRGLWIRARGSVSFWAGLVIIAVMLLGPGNQVVENQLWTNYVMRLNPGLAYSLPVLAIASGWLGARSRIARLSGASIRLRQFWRDAWPLLSFTSLGYLAALVVILVASGWPIDSPPHALVLSAQASMVLAAVGIGHALGYVLPRVLVIFAAPAATATVLLLLFAWGTPWRIVMSDGYAGVASVPSIPPFLGVILVGALLTALGIAVAAIRPLWARVLLVLTVTSVAVGVATSGEPPAEGTMFVERPPSELVCSMTAPEVCLWPEQETAFGTSLRADMAVAHDMAVALRLPVDDEGPRMAARFGAAGTYQGEDTIVMGLSPDFMVNYYASTFIWDYVELPAEGNGESLDVMYSIAILLGVPPENAWPAGPDSSGSGSYFDASEVPDLTTARDIVERWLREGVDGVRSPYPGAS